MTSINNNGTPSVPTYSHSTVTNSETSPTGANGGGGFNLLNDLFTQGTSNGGSGNGGGLDIGGIGGNGQIGSELQALVGLLEDLVKMLGGNTPSGGSTQSGVSGGTGGTQGVTGGPVGVNDASGTGGTSGAGGATGTGGASGSAGTGGASGTSAGGTTSGASGASGSAGNAGGSPEQQMQQWQQKYLQDWANPATRSQAAQDWQNYLQAAQAWQMGGAGAAGGAANGGSGNGATSLSGGSGGGADNSGGTQGSGGTTGGTGVSGGGGTGGSGGTTGGSGGATNAGGTSGGSSGGGSVTQKTGIIHNPTSSSYSKDEVAAACKNGSPGFPSPSQWSSFAAMWDKASKAMPNTAQQNQWIHDAIVKEAGVSGVDPRIILATIMQESGGSVNVPTTNNGVRNPGLMQSHDGVAFDPANPQQSIFQMVKDGVEGTYGDSSNPGAGLAQCIQATGNPYAGMRLYNSGTVDMSNLNNAEGATGAYVTEMAAKLTGNPGGG